MGTCLVPETVLALASAPCDFACLLEMAGHFSGLGAARQLLRQKMALHPRESRLKRC